MGHEFIFIIAACVIGFLMAWGVGANDLANIMSTAMGSKAISIRQAVIIAVIFELAGGLLGSSHVTDTIRHGIINTDLLANNPASLLHGMLAVLMAGMVWMLFASYIGMPVSITHATIGALVGFGAMGLGVSAIHWKMVQSIALAWIFAPFLAALVGYGLFVIIRKLILSAEDPSVPAKKYLPLFFFGVGVVLTFMVVIKDLKQYGYILNIFERFGLTIIISSGIALMGTLIAKRVPLASHLKRHERFEYVEKLFSILMAFTACAMVFAHGSNDIAITVGPISAVLSLVQSHGGTAMADKFPEWLLLIGSLSVLLGLFMYGHRVIATVGERITTLTPSRAFCATLAAAATVILSTNMGIPVSATQTLVGGVLGVGFARGIGALNLAIVRNIFLSWFVTIPAAAFLAIFFFRLLEILMK